MKSTQGFLLFLATTLLMINISGFAQEEESEPADCRPASLESPYDKFKDDSLDPQQVNIWYSYAYENYKHEQWEKAVSYYWKVMVNDQTGRLEKVTYGKLVDCYKNIGKTASDNKVYLDSTFLVIYRGLEKYPDNASLHFHAGNLHRGLGQSECAIPHYQEMVKAYPKEVNYLKSLVDLYLDVDDEQAIDAQKKVTEMDPSLEEQLKYKNILERFGRDPMKAVVEAFEKDSTNLTVCINLATEALQRGSYELVLRAAAAGLKIESNNVPLLDSQAKAFEGLGRMNDAISSYREITNADPDNVNAYCSLALAYASVKNFSAAKSQVNKAISMDSQNGLPFITLGQIIEEAIDYCSNKRGKNEYNYDDNLAFEIAGREYAKAKRDPNYAARADSRINALKPFYRTKEQVFLRQNNTTIKDACYTSWLSY